MSQADSAQWQQFDASIREDNRAAVRTIKALRAARAEEQDVLEGRPVAAAVLSCEGCDATIPDERWSKTRSGWFQTKDGKNYCPEHTPDWVAEWREKRGKS